MEFPSDISDKLGKAEISMSRLPSSTEGEDDYYDDWYENFDYAPEYDEDFWNQWNDDWGWWDSSESGSYGGASESGGGGGMIKFCHLSLYIYHKKLLCN